MATTEEYKDGGSASYTFSIEKIKDEDIKVSVDGTDLTYTATNPPAQTTEYTVNGSNVIFKQASVSGSTNGGVRIYRETALENADSATFVAGSSIRAADLNANHKLVRFSAQEKNQKIVTDDIRDSQVTSAKILDGTIVDADINASANIQGSKILNDSLTLDKLGAGALPTDITVASANIVDETIVDGDINANANIQGTKLLNDSVPLTKFGAGALPTDITVASANIVDGTIDTADLKNSAVTQNKLDDNSVGTPELINGSVTDAKIETGTLDNRYFTETELDPTANTGQNVLDARYYTETEADARFYNLASAEEIQSGETWVAADNKVATTSAIDARIIDLVDDVGGFHPIPNETSFPSVNIDVNNGAGTLISIKEIVTARTPSSGTVTITDGAGTGNDVVINGCGSTVLPAGFGVIVETTTTTHTYTFHRLTPKATEVTTVAGSIANVNTTAGSIGNVNIVGPDIANVNTVAGSIGNVNTVAGSISSVNNASSNISSINNFGDLYQVNSSNPSTDGGGASLAAGDLYFNTSADRLKVYTGSDWVDGVIASGGGAQTSGDTFTGDLKLNDNVKLLVGTGSDLEIYHDGSNSYIEDDGTGSLILKSNHLITNAATYSFMNAANSETLIYAVENGSVKLYFDNSAKFKTTSTGITSMSTDAGAAQFGTAATTTSFAVTGQPELMVGGGASKDNAIGIESNTTAGNDYDSNLVLARSRGTHSSKGIVQSGDFLGSVGFYGYDGAEYERAAEIAGIVDGTPGTNDMPTRLEFKTTQDGANVPTTRLTITNDGKIQIPADNAKLQIGANQDLEIYHDGSNSYIKNTTGNLFINHGSDMGVKIEPNAKVQLFYDGQHKFDTRATGAFVNGRLDIGSDSWSYPKALNVEGESGAILALRNWDTTTYAADTNTSIDFSILTGNTGNLSGSCEIRAFKENGTNGDNARGLAFYTGNNGGSPTKRLNITSDGNVQIPADNTPLQIGAGQDLELYHTGSANHIDSSTPIAIRSDVFQISTLDGTHKYIDIPTDEQGVEFYYDNIKKLETASDGIIASGAIKTNASTSTAGSADQATLDYNNGNLRLLSWKGTGASSASIFTKPSSGSFTEWFRVEGDGGIKLPVDNQKLYFGTGHDLSLYHDGTDSFIENDTGVLRLNSDTIYLKDKDNGDMFIQCLHDAGVQLRYDNNAKLDTTTDGVSITGHLTLGENANVTGTPHTYKYTRGSSKSGVSIYESEAAMEIVASEGGTHSASLLIRTAVDGVGFNYNPTDNALELKTFTTTADDFSIHASGANVSNLDTQLRIVKDGAVELSHNGTKKLETTSTGATVTGQLEADTFGDIKLADPFIEMAQTITTSRTISNNYNAFTVGPVTINTGVTVTVGDGENWVIV